MEKLVYAIRDADERAVTSVLPQAMQDAGASSVRVNVQDKRVASGEGLIQSRGDSLPNAVAQCWLPSANPLFRRSCDDAVSAICSSFHAWLVAESTIIPNEEHLPVIGEPTAGFAQLAFLTKPQKKSWNEWREVWRDYHTQVAIDTQSNFEYVQNVVVEPLTVDAPPFVAIVEECFPIEALTDPQVFFDAAGDQQKFEKNLGIMMESCGRFIDPGTIDVFPTSQYDFANH